MREHDLGTLIEKYQHGDISKQEIEYLKELLQQPEHKMAFDEIIQGDFELQCALQQVDSEDSYSKVQSQIKVRAAAKQPFGLPIYKYAAIFIGLIASGLFVYFQFLGQENGLPSNEITLQLNDGSVKVIDVEAIDNIINTTGKTVLKQEKNVLSYAKDTLVAKEDLGFNELRVPYGKKIQVSLSDGSYVYLNAGSVLKYPVRFPKTGKREVFLDGEGFFEVTTNKAQPFVVNTEDVNTVVLGTKFNVSSYKNEGNTATVLVEGAVRVETENTALTIAPGQRAFLENGTMAMDQVNVAKHIAWTKGQLYFENDHFSLITKELERHFDVSIQTDHQKLNNTPFTGTFEKETLEDILVSFQLHSDFQYKISGDGKTITINQ